jgi:hypothetical protein
MNWAKENKFLTGFIAVMVIGVGALGYQVYSASSAYDEAVEGYTKASAEYNRLRHLTPFPNRQNLEQFEAQKENAVKAVSQFEADLAAKEIPLESISPSGFQDKLKEAVTSIRQSAQNNGILLFDKFYLSFDKYESIPPSPEAAGPLLRQMKTIEWVVNQFLAQPSSRMQKLVGITRLDLPEERGKGAPGGGKGQGGAGFGGPGGGKGPGAGGPGGGGGRRDLVKYHPFNITVIAKQEALMNVLKAIASPKAPQFLVLRKISIRNQNEKGPSKVDPNAPAPGAPGDPKDNPIKYIVGEEWIEATLHLEMVDFTAPGEKLASEQSSSSPKTTPARK